MLPPAGRASVDVGRRKLAVTEPRPLARDVAARTVVRGAERPTVVVPATERLAHLPTATREAKP
jgi:hypothetical protein